MGCPKRDGRFCRFCGIHPCAHRDYPLASHSVSVDQCPSKASLSGTSPVLALIGIALRALRNDSHLPKRCAGSGILAEVVACPLSSRAVDCRASMGSEHRSIAFRWVLPAAQLLLCVGILWPLRGELISSVRSSTHAYVLHDEPAQDPKVDIRVLYPKLLPDSSNPHTVVEEREYRDRFLRLRLWAPALLNLPAVWLELPRAIVSHDKNEWVPVGMSFQYWRALAWPVVGIGVWWFVGRGVEALISAFRGVVRPAISYVETAIAVLFALLGAVIFLGPLLDPSSLNDGILRYFFVLAGAMWVLLGAAIILARLAQWRIRRRSAARANGAAVPA